MPQPPSAPERVAKFMVARRYWLAAVGLLSLLAALPLAGRLEFDRRIEQMFPADDPAVDSFTVLRERFGGNAIAMLVFPSPKLMTPEGITQVEGLAERARRLDGVLGVLSLGEVNEALESVPSGLFAASSELPPILERTRIASAFRQIFAGYTHDAEGTLGAVVAMLDPGQPEAHGEAIAGLRRLAAELPASQKPVALVGEPVLVAEGFAMVDADGRRLATTTIVLLGLTTLLLFRSPRWVVAQLIVIFWSVQATRGLSHVLGLQLSMVSSMLTAIVTVIAVACVVHLGVRFGTRRLRGDSRRRAATETLALLLPPIFWACLTDAAGFAALMIAEVGPVRDFGLMMTLGASMVLLGIVLWMPLVMLVPAPGFSTHHAPGDHWIRRSSVRLVYVLHRHRLWVAVATAVVAGLTAVGLQRLRTETNFIRNFRASSELAQNYAMVENQFGGAGVWDILLPAPRTLTGDYLRSVRALESELREISVQTPRDETAVRLTKVLSLADADAAAAQSRLLRLATPAVRISGMRAAMPTFANALLTPAQSDSGTRDESDQPPPRLLRIMLRSPEQTSSAAKLQLIEAVRGAVEEHTSAPQWLAFFPESRRVAGQVTGYYVLLARLIESLLRDQWLCLLLASSAIFVMIAIAFRSIRTAAICMIPNLLPVLAVLAALGLSGTRINMGAAMIAAVSIGLTIDGSIHFVSGCQRARRRGAAPLRAVLHAQRRVGLPVLLATVSLAIGFSVLATSPFVPTVTFGVLVTAALISGTATNLTVLPLLLVRFPPRPG